MPSPARQGAIDARRRDYSAAFAAAAHPAVLAQLEARGERLLLVGHKTPEGLPNMPEVRGALAGSGCGDKG